MEEFHRHWHYDNKAHLYLLIHRDANNWATLRSMDEEISVCFLPVAAACLWMAASPLSSRVSFCPLSKSAGGRLVVSSLWEIFCTSLEDAG